MPPLELPPEPWTIDGVMDDLRRQLDGDGSDGAARAAAPTVLGGDPGRDIDAMIRHFEDSRLVAPQYQIRSHRPVVGRVFDFFRKLSYWGPKPFVDEMAHRQTVANEAAIRALRALAARLDAFVDYGSQAIMELERRAEAAEAELRELRAFEARQLEYNAGVEAFKAAERAFEKRIDERHDLGDFFMGLTPEKRRELMERFRGPFGEIWGWLHIYVEHFRDRPGQILDVGCGRGEFLHMMRGEGIEAWGCDVDPVMLEVCKEHGVNAVQMDAMAALHSVAPASLGGIFSSQVAEHLFPGELLRMIKLAREKLAPGGVFVMETLNPQSLGVLSKSYYRDLDHKQPIDPDYLRQLVEFAGFVNVEARLIHDFKPEDKLPELPSANELGLTNLAHAKLSEMAAKLNKAIWGAQDYYILAEVPKR